MIKINFTFIKLILVIIIALIFINKSSSRENFIFQNNITDTIYYKKIEIIDSAICLILDSIISFEKYCTKRKSNYPNYYEVIIHYDILNKEKKLLIYSMEESIPSDSIIAVLFYKDRYFVFDDFENCKIKELYSFLRLSQESLSIENQRKTLFYYSKTRSQFAVKIESDSLYITSKHCFCHYGKLSRKSKCLRFRMFFYKLFCPIRASRRL